MREKRTPNQPLEPESWGKNWIHTFLDDNLAEIWVWMVEACQSLEFQWSWWRGGGRDEGGWRERRRGQILRWGRREKSDLHLMGWLASLGCDWPEEFVVSIEPSLSTRWVTSGTTSRERCGWVPGPLTQGIKCGVPRFSVPAVWNTEILPISLKSVNRFKKVSMKSSMLLI